MAVSDNRTAPLVQVRHLKQYFPVSTGLFTKTMLKAVDDVSFEIEKGETLGLVGESGCGKTTVGRTMLHLYEPTEGEIWFDGTKIEGAQALHSFRRRAQMVFQDPYSSLNPRMTVADIVAEPIDVHHLCPNKKAREDRIRELMSLVGLNTEHATRYAHELSGGQRQRIGIARALASQPEFIVCDGPVSALDVSIQAQVINMLKKLQSEMHLTYLFIAHDLSVVKYISDRVIVMYLGTIVEEAEAEELYAHPLHPYTQALLSSIPVADPELAKSNKRIPIKGEIPSPINPKDCCQFAERCPYATERCFKEMPKLKKLAPEHSAACHLLT